MILILSLLLLMLSGFTLTTVSLYGLAVWLRWLKPPSPKTQQILWMVGGVAAFIMLGIIALFVWLLPVMTAYH